jgi:hypothetical protein
MVDATKYGEGDYVSVDLINKLVNRTGIIISVEEKDTKFGIRLVGTFEFESEKRKEWTLPISTVNMFVQTWGKETSEWLGRRVLFLTDKNKIVANPIPKGETK